jgi:hypothetical protein
MRPSVSPNTFVDMFFRFTPSISFGTTSIHKRRLMHIHTDAHKYRNKNNGLIFAFYGFFASRFGSDL